MYCVKCGVELPTQAKFCVGCGKVVDGLPVAPLAEESNTRITAPQSKAGGSPPQDRTLQVAGGVLAILLLMGAAYWYLVERNMVREPVYKVGDTWTHRWPGPRLPDDVGPPDTSETVVRVGGQGDVEVNWVNLARPWWKSNYVLWETNSGREGMDKTPYLRFPLEPRKTWSTSSSYENEKGLMQAQTHYQVGEWEAVTVLAGSFRSLPVHATTTQRFAVIGSEPRTLTINTVEWFAPDTKTVVKKVRGGSVDYELKTYSVK